MRILVEPSDYLLLNIGDVSMLQVGVARLRALWPEARIQILTDEPDALAFHCPEGDALPTDGRKRWFAPGWLFGRLSYGRPKPVTVLFSRLETVLRRRWPLFAKFAMYGMASLHGDVNRSPRSFLEAVETSDLVVVTGMGGITDAFPHYALELLDTLSLAIRRGKTTAMFGQGIGPIVERALWARAKAVLPAVDLICLREGRTSGPMLQSLGVSPGRVLVTGDDALEIANQMPRKEMGNGLGVNVRRASYSGVTHNLVKVLRSSIIGAAMHLKVSIVPVPISRRPSESDAVTIRELLAGFGEVSDRGEESLSPLQVIELVRDCRTVVAGSYHAAVFALAQGVPVVGLVNSDYYAAKFLGLAEQFEGGCEVVFLSSPKLAVELPAAIQRAWDRANSVRPSLMAAALQQIERGHGAYRRLYDLVVAKETP